MDVITDLSRTFKINPAHSRNLIGLIEDGCTIPFIAHYRKDEIGLINESILWDIKKYYYNHQYIQKIKSEVTDSLKSSKKLTNEIKSYIHRSRSLGELDIIRKLFLGKEVLPLKKVDKDLDSLVDKILSQEITTGDPLEGIALDDSNKPEDYISTAINHVAKKLKENIKVIKFIWSILCSETVISTTFIGEKSSQKQPSESKRKDRYKTYSDYREKFRNVAPLDVIIINKGEMEKILSVKFEFPDNISFRVKKEIIRNKESIHADYLDRAADKAINDFLLPVMIRSLRREKTYWAEDQRIKLYQKNLRSLLLNPPLNGKIVMGLDTGHQSGCKMAVIGRNSEVLETGTLFTRKFDKGKIEKTISLWIEKHKIDIISIGNGFRLREIERIAAALKKNIGTRFIIVDEGGIDEYSYSPLANRELRGIDANHRGAVSIARRSQDPLSELVKVDPTILRLGPYQYEVNQRQLTRSLSETVSSCVNSRRVDVNTASVMLLRHISGMNSRVVNSIISTRNQEGDFRSREELKNVKGFNNKIFEQCSGFILIHGKNPLDESPIHPEKYLLAENILDMVGSKPSDLRKKQTRHTAQLKLKMNYTDIIDRYSGTEGKQAVINIIETLGNLYSDSIEVPLEKLMSKEKISYESIVKGNLYTGIVTKVTDYGAFIDIGLKQNGMVHISELSVNFISHPTEIVQVGDTVDVKVIDVDKNKKRISLSMKNIVSKNRSRTSDSSFKKDAERLDKLKSMRKSGNIRFK